jgi:hypothetical protein
MYQRLNENEACFNNRINTQIIRPTIIIVRRVYRVKIVTNSVVKMKSIRAGKPHISHTKKH